MNQERLLREVEKRLSHLSPADRAEAVDAIREEIGRERRRDVAPARVEVERERRAEAETLREILEAINRQATLEETIDEVLKQLARIVMFDSCSLALLDGEGRFRIIATRGFPDPSRVLGLTFRDPLTETLRSSTAPLSISDVAGDARFEKIEGTEAIRSWAGIPLLVEGDVIGLLCLDRHQVNPFSDENLHSAKAVAFSAAAAIRKAQLLAKVRRYAALMERVVKVDQAVFEDRPAEHLARLILEGALRVGSYSGGLLVLKSEDGARVAAATEGMSAVQGKSAPPALCTRKAGRLDEFQVADLAQASGLRLPALPIYLVPLATDETLVGTLALVDPGGDSPDDHLMEAYASRAAAAYEHATRRGR